MDNVVFQFVSFAPAPQQWLDLPQARMISAAMWEGGEAAQKEVRQLINALRRWIPFLPGREESDEGFVDSHPKAKQRLAAAMEAASVVDGVGLWRTRLLSSVSVIQFGGVATAAISCLSPQGPGCCDFNNRERVANVVTSLPYAAIGVHSMRNRRTAAGKLWGASMLGVCAGSITFHVSSGKWRDLGRKLDYWTIALSSGMLTRALYPKLPPVATAASIVLTPFRPFLVSASNAMAMESKFLQRSFQNPDLRGAQKLHSAACLAGMALFAVEDASVPHIPLVHASWHCLSALGTAMVNHVLADAEEQFPELTLDALQLPGSEQEVRKQMQQQRQQQKQQQLLQRNDLAPLGRSDLIAAGYDESV